MILSVIVILIGIRILLLEAPLGFCNFHGFLPRVQRMQPVGISSRSRVQLRASAGPTVAELESFIQKATNPGDTATVSKYSRQQEDDVCLQLNVGGDIMASTRKTLMSVHEDSKLYKMMDNPTLDQDGRVFIDHTPSVFKLLLSMLRKCAYTRSPSLVAQQVPNFHSEEFIVLMQDLCAISYWKNCGEIKVDDRKEWLLTEGQCVYEDYSDKAKLFWAPACFYKNNVS